MPGVRRRAPCVPGRLRLTNAHSVAHATQVRVKRRGDDKSYAARVLTIGAQCDCALLAVDDEDFWTVDGTVRDVQPLKLGRLPRLEDAVAVVGYPVGGDTLSVTRGVVSRIEITPYSLASAELLSMQIDAAINPGNSGGPVFNADGECVGIAFESLVGEDTENCGYAIPSPIVRHFVSDYQRHGTFTGFPRMGVQLQNMENEALRRAAGVPDGKKGVLVQRVEPTGGAADILEPGDVLHSYDGLEISNDGTIAFRAGQRIGCSFAMMSRFAGETVRVGYSRQGEIHEADVAVSVVEKAVPAHIRGNMPPFLVVAGLVFVEVTEAYLRNEYGDEFSYDAPVSLVQTMVHGMRSHTDEELVVVSKVLANEISLGYEHVTNAALKTCQGQPVRNLRHLTELVDETLRAGDTFLEFGLEQGERIVLSAHAVPAATTEVLEANAIPADRSADLPSPSQQQQ